MTSKRANWLFLTIILVHFGVVAFLIFGGEILPDSLMLNFLLSQGILIVPTILFLLIFGCGKRLAPQMRMSDGPQPVPGAPGQFEAAGFHRVKISTLLMIILCTFLIMPLVTVLNTLTMFFADNAVAAMEGDIISTPFPAMLFMIGIFGPFCEEFVFRGVIYGSYRRSGGYEKGGCCQNTRNHGIAAVLLSAFLFGLMHMNFNQALYAFGIGIFLALLVEAAGSLWASVFCHMFFNSFQVVLMYVSGSILDSVYGQAVNEAAEQLTARELLAVLSVYLVIAAVTTPIAGCVVVWIAKNEGRQAAFGALFHRRDACMADQRPPQGMPQPQMDPSVQLMQQRTDYLLSVPLIIAVVLCFGYMSLELFLA